MSTSSPALAPPPPAVVVVEPSDEHTTISPTRTDSATPTPTTTSQPTSSRATSPALALNPTELIEDATRGFDSLLNNQLDEGKAVFERYPDSPAHNVGQGIAVFLQAALGQEDAALYGALTALTKAETLSNKEVNVKRAQEGPTVYASGLEYKVLVSDAVMSQALCHVLTESYVEFMKAIYKLNRAYKGFKSVYNVVFPDGVDESDSLESIFVKLNSHYLAKTESISAASSTGGSTSSGGASTPNSSTASPSSFFGSWGKKRTDLASNQVLRHSSSAATLPSQLHKLGISDEKPNITISAPGSRLGSRAASIERLQGERVEQGVDGSHPAPLWKGDPITSLVIGGAAFGYGLFGLIFSLLPPKLRKLISWFGFGNSNRSAALKLLTVAASTGNDTHAAFASLTLLTFYCVVLLMSGWQSDEAYLLNQCEIVLDRVIARFPEGTLWVLNRAKLCRMRHDTHQAISILESSLAKGSSFREADSLLVFELGWCYLSDAQWVKTADTFCRMCELNNWSHSTYIAIAAGALVDERREHGGSVELDQRIDALYTKLPGLLGGKRMLGEPPTTETFIGRRLTSYKAKHARWVEEGRLGKDSKWWEAIRITSAMELGFVWATIGGRSPPPAVKVQIDHLSSLTPSPAFGPHSRPSSSPSPLRRCSTSDDLDTIDEIATRSLLLGALYRSINDAASLLIARQFLQSIIKQKDAIKEERWVASFAMFELAVVECKEAESEAGKVKVEGGDEKAVKKVWKDGMAKAEKLIETLFASGEYDLKSRLESRTMQLRDEIGAKKKKLGI